VAQLQDGDALALDHRGTPQVLMRGVDPVLLLLELMGHADGLCAGMGGHMHLFSREHLAASSGIVGASGPAAVGFALVNQYLRPGKVAVAFFGEGAANQGMMMEAFNLAAVWNLPVIFVCKDNLWGITTPSESVTSGSLVERAASFGISADEIDGSDVTVVWASAQSAIDRARQGNGPSFILMRCFRPEGHFAGDPLVKNARNPIKGMLPMVGPLVKSVTKIKGASLSERTESVLGVLRSIGTIRKNLSDNQQDPIKRIRETLMTDPVKLQHIEKETSEAILTAVETALQHTIAETGDELL
jgi:pyruvate dehydrogenase E1 component alpha subunit